MSTFDPSHEYAYVKGTSIDAKHPNGDIDRIKTTGDHSVGDSFLMRGEPLVYVMSAMRSLMFLNSIQTYYRWYAAGNFVERHDTTIRYESPFSREITSAQINHEIDRLRSNVIPFLCRSNDAPIAKGSFTGNYLDANPSFRVDPSGFRTHKFEPIKHLSITRKDIIEALVADIEDIMDGSFVLVTGLTPPSFRGWSPKPRPGMPNDCTMNNIGEEGPEEEIGSSYMPPSRRAYEKRNTEGKTVLVNYEVIPNIVNRFSVRMFNASKSLFDDGATRRHVSITALFKLLFSGTDYLWFPVEMTEKPSGMASIQSDVFSGIFEKYCEEFDVDLPSREHKKAISFSFSDVNIIVQLSKTRE